MDRTGGSGVAGTVCQWTGAERGGEGAVEGGRKAKRRGTEKGSWERGLGEPAHGLLLPGAFPGS